MARVIQNLEDYETWKSDTEGTVIVKRYDRNGKEIDEKIGAGREIRLLPEERRLNQEIAAEPGLDPFQNGLLRPVKLVETADDIDDIREYANHLTEDDMRGLLKDSKATDKLKEAILTVSNPTTLVRFLAIADEEETDATVRQIKILKARLEEVSAQTDYIEMQTSDGRPVIATSAPKSPAPINPGMGRRS